MGFKYMTGEKFAVSFLFTVPFRLVTGFWRFVETLSLKIYEVH